MKTVVIDRSKWRTGGSGEHATGSGATRLTNEDGCKCCLGFICSAYKKKTVGLATPAGIECKVPFLTQLKISDFGNYYQNTELSADAMAINDDFETTPEEKERKIKALFDGKINLEFVGEFTKYYE